MLEFPGIMESFIQSPEVSRDLESLLQLSDRKIVAFADQVTSCPNVCYMMAPV